MCENPLSSQRSGAERSCPSHTTIEINTEQLRRFLAGLEAGKHPSIVDVMSALNNISVIMTPNAPCIDCEHHV